jgi:pimeloyl-ACP methyl ester carboxylesterase
MEMTMTMTDFADRWWSSAEGLRLYARDYPGAAGEARLPVVCLHGLTRNSADFEDVAPWLAETGRRVLVPDVRGRGRSDRDPDPTRYNPAVYAADVLALLDGLGIARAVFIGTSMGGLITMMAALTAPVRVTAAVLNDVGPELSLAGLTRIGGYVGQAGVFADWSEAAAYARQSNAIAFPDYGVEDWDRFARRIAARNGAGELVLAYDPAISAAVQPALEAPNLWPLFEPLATGRPVLLVRGALSDILDDAIAARTAERAPQVIQAVVPGVGHAPMLTEPAARAALAEFLAGVA